MTAKVTEERVRASIVNEEVSATEATYTVDAVVQERPVKAAVTQTAAKVALAERGPQGPPGPEGADGQPGPEGPPGSGADTTYTHNQGVPSPTWVITHNLGRFPSVSVVDSAGTVQIGDIIYDTANQVTVSFTASFAGKAYLN